jgi:hypothetical protein
MDGGRFHARGRVAGGGVPSFGGGCGSDLLGRQSLLQSPHDLLVGVSGLDMPQRGSTPGGERKSRLEG